MKWKAVPVEATEEMLTAGENYDVRGEYAPAGMHWAEMLAAAPPISADEEMVEKVARHLCRLRGHSNPSELVDIPGALYQGGPIARARWQLYASEARAVLRLLEGK